MGEFLFSVMYGGSLIIIGLVVQYFLKDMQQDMVTTTDVQQHNQL
mgnify:CR=1 FL=1